MKQETTLLNFEQKAEEKAKFEKMFFEGQEFNNWMERDFNEEGNFSILCKTKTNLATGTEPAKNGKIKFILVRNITYNIRGEVIEEADKIECKTLDELINLFETEKGNLEAFKEASDKGVMFDGRRYWHKIHISDYKVYWGERVVEW